MTVAISLSEDSFLVLSGLGAAEVVAEVVFDNGLLVGTDFALADFLGAAAGLLGGVTGTFSFFLDALAAVGRIILARKPSSTLASFFTTGWSLAGNFGGGPMLGRCLPAAEDDLSRALVRFVERAEFSWEDGGAVPEGILLLDPEAVVWVVRLGGSLTGRVGDFGLGLTKPAGETLTGAAFFSVLGVAAFGVVGGWDVVLVGLAAGFGCGAGSGDFTASLLIAFLEGSADTAGFDAPAGSFAPDASAGSAAAAGFADAAGVDLAGVGFAGASTAFTPLAFFTSPPAGFAGVAEAAGVDFAGVPTASTAFTPFVFFTWSPAGPAAGAVGAVGASATAS